MAALECKVAMVISRLVKFELLLELKFEQKSGASLHTMRCKDATSFKTVERLSVPVILCQYRRQLCSELARYRWISIQIISFRHGTLYDNRLLSSIRQPSSLYDRAKNRILSP
jgi:hypothetical protein